MSLRDSIAKVLPIKPKAAKERKPVPGDPRPISTEERFVAIVRRATRKGRPVVWPPRQAPRRAVPRSTYLARSPKAARKVACDATGRPLWRTAGRVQRRAERDAA